MTITEFLLARVADDEERARFVDSQHDEWARRQRWEPWRLSWQDEYDLLCIDPARAIAECEAKRRIVEMHSAALSGSRRTLAILATVYADHPDYNEAWRP